MTDEIRTDWETTSFSELATLATCEEKWYRRYVLREPSESGPAALKGTLWHEGTGALLMGGTLDDAHVAMKAALAEEGIDPRLVDDKTREAVEDAWWLVERYSRHYAVQLKQVKVVAHELRLARDLTYFTRDGWKKVTVKGNLDTLVDFGGRLWLREAKSSGRKDVLDTAYVAPQITLYWWLVEEMDLAALGYDKLYGVLLDYAYTYRWKLQKPTQGALIEERSATDKEFAALPKKAQTEWARVAVSQHPGIEAHADSESFEQLWLDRTAAQVDAGLRWAEAILERRYALTQALPDRPPTIRNMGLACRSCDHKANCYGEMAFPQDDIVLDLT